MTSSTLHTRILAGRHYPSCSLFLKCPDLESSGVLGMRAGVGCPVRVAQALLQLGRPLVHLDRSGVRRQLPPFRQRGPGTGADRALVRLPRSIGCLVGFLEDATNPLNGLASQVPKALQRLALDRTVAAHGRPTILNKPVRQPARSPPPYRAVAGAGEVWLALARGILQG